MVAQLHVHLSHIYHVMSPLLKLSICSKISMCPCIFYIQWQFAICSTSRKIYRRIWFSWMSCGEARSFQWIHQVHSSISSMFFVVTGAIIWQPNSPNWPISKKLSLKTMKLISCRITWPNNNKPGVIRQRGGQKVRISYICHERTDGNLTIASRGITNESVGAKFTRNR